MIYKGNAKIRDIGNFGVFYGNNPIRQVFKGSELVYQYHPFEPQSIIINKSESITVEHDLPQGRYYVECVGGGGRGKYGQAGWFAQVGTGGSGARFSANMQVTGNHSLKMVCGVTSKTSSGTASTLTIDNILVANAGGGVGTDGGGRGGVGGTVSSNTSVSGITFSNVVNRNGNNGNYNGDAGHSTVKGAASVASTGNYGASSDANTGNAAHGVAGVNGWIYLKYLGAI